MRNEFTAIIERDGAWYIAYCPEIPGANGQGKTKDERRAESCGGDCADPRRPPGGWTPWRAAGMRSTRRS